MAAAVPLEVWSLRAAHGFTVTAAPGVAVRVRAVPVRHVAALESLLLAQANANGWVVEDTLRVAILARIDGLLTLGVEGHVAVLLDNLYTTNRVAYLVSFREWTWELQDKAAQFEAGLPAAAGAPRLFDRVRRMCQLARKVVAGALNGRRTEDWLLGKLQDLEAEMHEIQKSTAFLYH